MKSIRVYKSGIHLGEEKLVAGNQNSGMINFSGCHLACNFCYTPETSQLKLGSDLTAQEFMYLVDELVMRGARNLNLISPTHLWAPLASPLLKIRLKYGRLLPIVLKISGFESANVIDSMASLADVFVPDFKVRGEAEAKSVNLPSNYGDMTRDAIQRMMRTHSQAHYNEASQMTHGMLVRHLMMPSFLDDSLKVVEALGQVGYTGHLNLMTYFINPKQKSIANAHPLDVQLLALSAENLGMKVLVNGKTFVCPAKTASNREETSAVG